MVYAMDWIAKVGTIPSTDLVLVSGTHYRLNMSDFLAECRRLEWEPTDGLWAANILDHTNVKVDFAGTDYAGFDEVVNGYTFQFGSGPTRVDIIGSNNNVVDVLIPTGISVVPSNSAGLVNSADLKAPTFLGKNGLGIHVAPTSGTDSSNYPYGNATNFCKTEANLVAIYTGGRNYQNVYIDESLTITGDHSAEENIWVGANPQTVVLTLDNACNVAGGKFQDIYITGQLTSSNIIWESIVGSITNANGFIYQSTLIGPIVFSGDTSLERCWAAPTQADTDIVLDFDGQQINVAVSGWNGGRILVKNMVTGSTFIANGSGHIEFDSTNTGGDWRIYPGFHYHDNSGASWTDMHDHTTSTEILTAAQTTPIHSNVKEVTDITITGVGTAGDPWGP